MVFHEVGKFRPDFMRFSKIRPRMRVPSESSVCSSEAGEKKVSLSPSAQRAQRLPILFIAGEGPAMNNPAVAFRRYKPRREAGSGKWSHSTIYLKKSPSESSVCSSEAGERKRLSLTEAAEGTETTDFIHCR